MTCSDACDDAQFVAQKQMGCEARPSTSHPHRLAESIRDQGGTTVLLATVTAIPGLVAIPVASVATLWSV